MGTNFYWLGHDHEYDIQQHIGKRSAAGLYCFDCGTTLNTRGTDLIHHGRGTWLKECPSCGAAESVRESLSYSAAGVELGLATREGDTPKGVRTACSFTWTLLKHKRTIEALRGNPEPVIEDEYGRAYTAAEFLAELKWCPIEFQSPAEFS